MAETETEHLVKAPRVSVPVEYNKRDLLIYAVGIGSTDPRYTYEKHPEFAAFPTYPISLTFKGNASDVVDFPSPAMCGFPSPHLSDVTASLDAEKYIEKLAELPVEGAKLQLVGGLVGVLKKGSGALVEHAYDLVDESGKVYYKMLSSGFNVGAKNFKASGASQLSAVKPPDAKPTFVVWVPTNAQIASIFRLSGDYNPLHMDPEVAKKAEFDQPILHGLCTMGHTVRAVLDAVAGGDHRRYKSIQLRFASPVLPGNTLKVEVWVVSPVEVAFRTTVKETGKVCISNGLMRLNPEAKL